MEAVNERTVLLLKRQSLISYSNRNYGPKSKQTYIRQKLQLLACIAAVFCLLELMAASYTNSLALLSTAFHLLVNSMTYIITLAFSYFAENRQKLGLRRFKDTALCASNVIVWLLTAAMTVEAVKRMNYYSPDVNIQPMLFTAIIALTVNIILAAISYYANQHLKSRSLVLPEYMENIQSKEEAVNEEFNFEVSALHVLGDVVASVGTLLSAITMTIKPETTTVDPLCTFLFSFVMMLSMAYTLLGEHFKQPSNEKPQEK